MLEKVIFFISALIIFVILSGKLIKRKDSLYLYMIVSNIVGMIIRYIEVSNSNTDFNYAVAVVCYVISIIIPFIIILLEVRKIFISEIIVTARAKLFLKLGQNEKARKILVKYIDGHQDSHHAHKLLAYVYEIEGKFEEAIDEYVIVVDLNKKDYVSYYEIAYLLNRTDKKKEARNMLENLLQKKPDYIKASNLLGTILYDEELFRESINVYLNALKYNPQCYELYYGLGMSYTRLNDFQTAKEYYEKAAELNSMLFHARISMAQIMIIAGEIEEAEQKFIECLEDKNSEPDAYFYLAIISMLKGKRDRAVSYLNIAIELDKKIYKRACKQDIFIPIMDEIRCDESRKYKSKLTEQELKTRRHLDDTLAIITGLKSGNGRQNYDSSSTIKREKDTDYRDM